RRELRRGPLPPELPRSRRQRSEREGRRRHLRGVHRRDVLRVRDVQLRIQLQQNRSLKSDRAGYLTAIASARTCLISCPMSDGVTRRQLFVLVEAGAATGAPAARSSWAPRDEGSQR